MKTTQRNFHILNIFLLVCAGVCLVCYDNFGGLWLKGVTSGWFVLLGLVNLGYAWKRKAKNLPFAVLVAAGLFLGLCADVLLGIHFIVGVSAFALGHICYLIAFFTQEKPRWRDLACIAPAALVSVYLVAGTPYIQVEDALLQKLLIGYAVIIGCMLGKAVSNWRGRKSVSGWLIFVGSVMFWFSDVMLAFNMFGSGGHLAALACTYTYWPAQNILAYAIFHYVNEQRGRAG